MTAARSWLTDSDRDLLSEVTDIATAGHWTEDQDRPLFAAVNLIVVNHVRAHSERIARAIEDLKQDCSPKDFDVSALAYEIAASVARRDSQ